jgi:hypothetical protein
MLMFFFFLGNWSPALQIRTILLSIQALLGAPNPDDPLANDVAQRWKEDEKAAIQTGMLIISQKTSQTSRTEFVVIPNLHTNSKGLDQNTCDGLISLLNLPQIICVLYISFDKHDYPLATCTKVGEFDTAIRGSCAQIIAGSFLVEKPHDLSLLLLFFGEELKKLIRIERVFTLFLWVFRFPLLIL